jgi:hypothetical protein
MAVTAGGRARGTRRARPAVRMGVRVRPERSGCLMSRNMRAPSGGLWGGGARGESAACRESPRALRARRCGACVPIVPPCGPGAALQIWVSPGHSPWPPWRGSASSARRPQTRSRWPPSSLPPKRRGVADGGMTRWFPGAAAPATGRPAATAPFGEHRCRSHRGLNDPPAPHRWARQGCRPGERERFGREQRAGGGVLSVPGGPHSPSGLRFAHRGGAEVATRPSLPGPAAPSGAGARA